MRADAGDRAYRSTLAVPNRTVAIVPGAAVLDGQPASSLRGRLETALALYRARRVKVIFVSGNDSSDSPEVTVMRSWLEERGVSSRDIFSDPHGSRTRETMLDAASLDITDAVICTQAPYVDRAIFLARHAGIDAVGVGLASPASRSVRGLGLEAIKTTVAVLESLVRPGPEPGRMPIAAKNHVALR